MKSRKKEICLHKKRKAVAAHLEKALRKQLGRRTVPIRKGDKVKVMRGSRKGAVGKVISVNTKKGTIEIEKVTSKKASGQEIQVPIHASNVLIIELSEEDERRFKEKSEKKTKEQQNKGKG